VREHRVNFQLYLLILVKPMVPQGTNRDHDGSVTVYASVTSERWQSTTWDILEVVRFHRNQKPKQLFNRREKEDQSDLKTAFQHCHIYHLLLFCVIGAWANSCLSHKFQVSSLSHINLRSCVCITCFVVLGHLCLQKPLPPLKKKNKLFYDSIRIKTNLIPAGFHHYRFIIIIFTFLLIQISLVGP
jgi:hypothetical protein